MTAVISDVLDVEVALCEVKSFYSNAVTAAEGLRRERHSQEVIIVISRWRECPFDCAIHGALRMTRCCC